MDTPAFRRARELLLGAGSITVLTGAGISAESRIPTFRDAQSGLWARPPLTEHASVVLGGTAAGVLPLLMAGASG